MSPRVLGTEDIMRHLKTHFPYQFDGRKRRAFFNKMKRRLKDKTEVYQAIRKLGHQSLNYTVQEVKLLQDEINTLTEEINDFDNVYPEVDTIDIYCTFKERE